MSMAIYKLCVMRPYTVMRWNIVQQNILIQQNVVLWWFLSMKVMRDVMIASWVDRYCAVIASPLTRIGECNESDWMKKTIVDGNAECNWRRQLCVAIFSRFKGHIYVSLAQCSKYGRIQELYILDIVIVVRSIFIFSACRCAPSCWFRYKCIGHESRKICNKNNWISIHTYI